MSDLDDILSSVNERGPCAPQVRIYLLSEGRPPLASLSAALPDYEIVVPHSSNEIAFIRKLAVESEGQFRSEAGRVAALVAPLVVGDAHLSCVYDNSEGCTQFGMDMRKTGGMPQFDEMDPTSATP